MIRNLFFTRTWSISFSYIWVKLFAAYIIKLGSNSKSKILLFGYSDSGINFSFPEIQRLIKSNFASEWLSSMNFLSPSSHLFTYQSATKNHMGQYSPVCNSKNHIFQRGIGMAESVFFANSNTFSAWQIFCMAMYIYTDRAETVRACAKSCNFEPPTWLPGTDPEIRQRLIFLP